MRKVLLLSFTTLVLAACSPATKQNQTSSGQENLGSTNPATNGSPETSSGNPAGGVTTGTGLNASITVFRAFSPSRNDHLNTQSFSEAQGGDYQPEESFSLHERAGAGLQVIYRCIRPGSSRFVSSVPNCEGFKVEGVLGYALTTPNSKPLHRCYNPTTDRHLLSVHPGECEAAGFTFEAILGYALE